MHLKVLQRTCNIDVWVDNELIPGTEWYTEVFKNLTSSQVVVLIISPSFIASEFCYVKELSTALELHSQKRCIVVPIYYKPVHYYNLPFTHIQSLPTNPRFVTEWNNADTACVEIVQGIEEAINKLIRDIVTLRQKEIVYLLEENNLLEACNRLMDFATDFSNDKIHHRRKALAIKATCSIMLKSGKDNIQNINEIIMMVLELLEDISVTPIIMAA